MSTPRALTVVSLLLATLLSACVGASAKTDSPVAAARPTRHPSPIDGIAAQAKRDYAAEVGGVRTHRIMRAVASDPRLLALLAARNLSGAKAYVAVKYPRTWYHWHVSRMRITQGSRLVTEVGVPYVVAPSSMALHSGGRTVGTLYVSMQDEIGFVRLEHRRYPKVQVVIRGNQPSLLRTSMHAAALVRLPANGTVRIAGTRYQVRSFTERSWEDGPVTIWLLRRG